MIENVFDELDSGIGQSAKSLGICRISLSRVLNGRAAISPDLTIKLEKAGISKATFWVNMQSKYTLWKTTKKPQPEIHQFVHAM